MQKIVLVFSPLCSPHVGHAPIYHSCTPPSGIYCNVSFLYKKDKKQAWISSSRHVRPFIQLHIKDTLGFKTRSPCLLHLNGRFPSSSLEKHLAQVVLQTGTQGRGQHWLQCSAVAPAAIVWLLNWSDDWGYTEDKAERVSTWWKIWIRLWLMKTSQSC